MGFDEIIGNEAAKRTLSRAIAQNRVSNAYVFEGMPGIGKCKAADVFARGLICENQHAAPCDACPSCRKAISRNHPDVIYLTKQSGKASVGVDDVREQVLNEVYMKPYLGERRVFIIGEGDDLSIEAQNALLKVLEEPPAYATFILCVTKQDKLLNTVLSRSHIISFFPLETEAVQSFLETKYGSNEKAGLFARLSQGSIGIAERLMADEDTERLYEESIEAILRLKKNAASVRETADFMIAEKERIGEVIDFCQTFLRDCVFIKSDLESAVVYENKRSQMRVFCDGISKKSLVAAFDRLTDFRIRLKQNLNYSASVLETVMRIWEDFHDKGSGHQI